MSKERGANVAISVFVIIIGCIVLAGWIGDIAMLRTLWLKENVAMKVNVAICLVISGTLLISYRDKPGRSGRIFFISFSTIILAVSALSLSQDIFHYYAGIDELWFKDAVARSHNYPYPGRMSVATAICLCLEGLGFLLLAYNQRSNSRKLQMTAQYCFHSVTLVSFITIMGFLFSVPSLFDIPYMPIMAIHTSVCLLLLSIGSSLLSPRVGITYIFIADKLGSRMARRVFPLVTVSVLLLGSFCVRLHKLGVAQLELGIMTCIFCFLLIALYVICRTAGWLNAIERERNAADKTIRQLYAELEKKVAERSAALHSTEANLQTIIQTTDTVYVLLDRDMKIVAFNESAKEFGRRELGISAETGSYLPTYFPPERYERVKRLLDETLLGQSVDYETSYVQPDGTLHWYEVRICPVFRKDYVQGILMSLRDITDRKLNEIEKEKITDELIQRNKTLEQFTYMVSHNLRAPLANILALSEIMNEEQLPEEEKKEVLAGISSSAVRLDNVIKDLNNILQVKKEIKGGKEEVSFTELVDETKHLLANQAENVIIKVDFKRVDKIKTVKGYVGSIFYNLMSNAIKYRRPEVQTKIDIHSDLEGGKVILYFKDNGLGIDLARNGDHIFGLYNRFHTHTEGKGMGLFMVKTQLETLGGRISVQSEVNKGTQFRIELPLS